MSSQRGLPHCGESPCGALLGFVAPWHECGSLWASWVCAMVQFFLLCFCTRQSLARRWWEEPCLGACKPGCSRVVPSGWPPPLIPGCWSGGFTEPV